MRRLVSLGAALALVVLAPASALAQPPAGTCPASASGFDLVDSAGWWERTVAGFAIAGIDVYDDGGGYTAAFEEFAANAGFASAAALYAYIVGDQFDGFDRNGNGLACMKDLPVNAANPGYLFQPADDVTSARR